MNYYRVNHFLTAFLFMMAFVGAGQAATADEQLNNDASHYYGTLSYQEKVDDAGEAYMGRVRDRLSGESCEELASRGEVANQLAASMLLVGHWAAMLPRHTLTGLMQGHDVKVHGQKRAALHVYKLFGITTGSLDLIDNHTYQRLVRAVTGMVALCWMTDEFKEKEGKVGTYFADFVEQKIGRIFGGVMLPNLESTVINGIFEFLRGHEREILRFFNPYEEHPLNPDYLGELQKASHDLYGRFLMVAGTEIFKEGKCERALDGFEQRKLEQLDKKRNYRRYIFIRNKEDIEFLRKKGTKDGLLLQSYLRRSFFLISVEIRENFSLDAVFVAGIGDFFPKLESIDLSHSGVTDVTAMSTLTKGLPLKPILKLAKNRKPPKGTEALDGIVTIKLEDLRAY